MFRTVDYRMKVSGGHREVSRYGSEELTMLINAGLDLPVGVEVTKTGVFAPERKPHGRGGTIPGSNECLACGASTGELHHPGCDREQCPICGEQLFACDHGEDLLPDA